ncbi:SpoIIE family protein phosphatase [Fibrobacterota bacterium]
MDNKPEFNLFQVIEFSKNQLEAIFDHLEPMCLVDREFIIIRMNKSMTGFLSKDFKTCIEKPLKKVFSEWDHVMLTTNVDLVFSSGRSIQIHDYSLMEKGKKGWFEITFYPVVNKEKIVDECVIHFKNVTELFLTKKILLEQYKRLEEQQMLVENKNTLLIETRKSLDVAYQALMDDLNVAREVQQGTLPHDLPKISGVDFFSSYQPISQVGGDIYDILDLGQNKIGIFIGDVSGHGLAPAFVGAMVKMALVDHAYEIISPRQLFSIINKNLIQRLKSGHYLTAFYGILDLNSNNFLYSKASHPNPVLIRADGDIKELETGGMFLGLIEEPGYEEKSIKLKKGDRLYLFTDGYFEVKNKEGEQITYRKLKDIIQSVHHLSKKRAHTVLVKKLREQTGDEELEDDRTFLIMEVTRTAQKTLLLEKEPFALGEDAIVRVYSTEEEFEMIFRVLEKYLLEKVQSEELRRRISICTVELSNNALEHGNKNDASKQIQIAYIATPEAVKVSVRDQGRGFSPDKLEDPRSDDNWRRERGRGIFIVRSYSDEVHFNEKGNMVTIVMYAKTGE